MKFTKIPTKGAGNCALYASVLVLGDLIKQDKLSHVPSDKRIKPLLQALLQAFAQSTNPNFFSKIGGGFKK